MFNLYANYRFLISITLLLFSLHSHAEQKEIFDGYEIHYNAFTSTFLTPKIAKQYGIVRSKAVGVLNISVLKTNKATAAKETLPNAVAAHVEGMVTNNIQQQRRLSFRRIIEGDAIYYIAEFQYNNNELLVFDIAASPQGQLHPLKLRFSQNFYND